MTEAFLGLTHKGPRHPPTEGTSTNLDIPVARSTSHSRDISHTAPKPYVISSDSTNSIKEQIRQLNQRLDEVQREFVKSKGELDESSKGRSPFVPVIQEKLVSTNFRLPALESYDSSSNPSEHVVAFRTQMALYDTSGAFMCGAFPTTLRDSVRLWYSQLKPTSISSFDSFAREVELNFLASSQLRPTTDSLLGLTQGSKETLAQFVICFTVKFRGMPDVHPSTNRLELPSPRSSTPLNSTHIEVFLQIRDKGILRPPNLTRTKPKGHDKRRYYCFHREYGHNMEECHDLKNQIEDLIRQGHLRWYVQDQHMPPNENRHREGRSSPRPKGPIKKQIDVIIGGPDLGGNSSSARKAHT
ncbi:hypothetical protein BHM03_00039922 [Ensete ventricosum]|nr:hypothetical protein BHM03_00039922 [Ensete ventricosum]